MPRNQDEMLSGGIVTPLGFSSLANHFTLLSCRDISRAEEEPNLAYVSRRLPTIVMERYMLCALQVSA